ncbi:kelch-like protein 10 [Conger conger]|uniref:kelch-like protein 10 n=1 Tax=Conger conger TaxID=82655 RepID=UPI002A5ADFAB|nr:kelch-like protein 10 [Conger conger]
MEQTDIAHFNKLRQEGTFCDVVVLVNGVEFKAHKIILCACSSYFRTLFTGSWNTGKEVYTIPGVSPDMMKLIIDYAYTQTVPIAKDNVEGLLTAADQFCIMGIVQACCDFLRTQLCPQNCIGIWRLMEVYFCPELRQRAYHFILRHFEEVGRTSEEFLGLSLAQLGHLLEQDLLDVTQEEVLFDLALRWIGHLPSERKSSVSVLLHKMRIGLMSTDFVLNSLKTNPLVKDSDECKLLIRHVMQQPRGTPWRPRLPSAVLLAIGGWSGGNPTNAVESYDVRADYWVRVSQYENPRAYHGTVYLQGFIYCIGGRDSTDYFNGVRRFDPLARAWHEAAPMHCRRCFVSVAVLDGHVYAMGGFDGYVRLDSAERYAPEANQWSLLPPMNELRSDASATTLHGKVYICGGFDGDDCLLTAEYYSPQTNQWTMITPMNIRRSGVGVTAYAGEVFVVGGFDGVNRLRSVDAYSPQTNSWRSVPEMLTARSNFAIEVMDNRLFVVGGFNGFTTTVNAECYDGSAAEWTTIQNMNFYRSALSCCTVPDLNNINHYAAPRGPL